MKSLIYLFIASIIVGLVCFVLMRLLFSIEFKKSIDFSIVAALSGFTVELLKPYISKLRGSKKSNH
jgi:hypothetical protein